MNKIPTFYENDVHEEQFLAKLKLVNCPNPECNKKNNLICNGLLTGNDTDNYSDKKICRGQRFLCSGRNNRLGCGRSFAIFKNRIIPRFSINAVLLSAFFKAYLQHQNVHASWQTLSRSFSLSTAYRIWKRLNWQQVLIRQRLYSRKHPSTCTSEEARVQLIEHLFNVFENTPTPITEYQSCFQAAFWI